MNQAPSVARRMCRAFNGPRTPGGHFFGRDQGRSPRRVTSDTPLERRPQPEVPSAGDGHDGMANSQAIVAAIGIPSFQRATNLCPACEVDARGPRPARTAAPVTRTGRSSRAQGHECIQQHKDKIGLPAAAKPFAFWTSTMSSKLSGPFSYKVASTSPNPENGGAYPCAPENWAASEDRNPRSARRAPDQTLSTSLSANS